MSYGGRPLTFPAARVAHTVRSCRSSQASSAA